MKKSQKRQGFSLLELLAVVVILGIIAAVVVPRVTTSSDKARTEVDAFNISTLNAAVERYYVNEGGWPSALSDLGTDYLPGGVPECPIEGKVYSLDTDNRVVKTDST